MNISQLPDSWDKQAREYTAQAAVMEGAKAIDSTIDQRSQVCTAATYRQCADQLRKALAKPAVPEWASALIADMIEREIELAPAQSLEALSESQTPEEVHIWWTKGGRVAELRKWRRALQEASGAVVVPKSKEKITL